MKMNCKYCNKIVDTNEIGPEGAYFNNNEEVVCYVCQKE